MLEIEKIKAETYGNLYKLFSPKPNEKLSIETAKPNNNISKIFRFFISFSSLKDSIIISIPIKNNTINTNVSDSIGNNETIFFPTNIPIKGIKK